MAGAIRLRVAIEDRSVGLAWHHANPNKVRERVARWDAANPGRRAELCKEWHAARPDYKKQWLKANPDKAKAHRRAMALKKYGLTIASYEALLIAQGSVCAVCSGPSKGRGRYHVDHNHTTGKVRGLLCHSCNTVLGHVNEDPARLAALSTYIERHA